MPCNDVKMQLRHHIANGGAVDLVSIAMRLQRLAKAPRKFHKDSAVLSSRS